MRANMSKQNGVTKNVKRESKTSVNSSFPNIPNTRHFSRMNTGMAQILREQFDLTKGFLLHSEGKGLERFAEVFEEDDPHTS
jgi:hypothetical protein